MKITETEIKEIREQLLLSPSTASPVWSEVEALASKVTKNARGLTYKELSIDCKTFADYWGTWCDVSLVRGLQFLFDLAEKAWFDAADEWNIVVRGGNHG